MVLLLIMKQNLFTATKLLGEGRKTYNADTQLQSVEREKQVRKEDFFFFLIYYTNINLQ